MDTKRANIAIALIIATGFAAAGLIYCRLPPTIVVHWDVRMRPDAWGSRSQIFFMPAMLIIWPFLLNLVPRISRTGLSIASFLPTYNLMIVLLAVYLLYVSVVTSLRNVDSTLPFGKLIGTGLLGLFVCIGNLFGKLRRNKWCGIRTPRTLSSDAVWIATHRFAGRLTVAVSAIGIAALWLGAPWWIALALLLGATLLAVIYSYAIRDDQSSNADGRL